MKLNIEPLEAKVRKDNLRRLKKKKSSLFLEIKHEKRKKKYHEETIQLTNNAREIKIN